MSNPPPQLVYLIERAAELRSAGHSWEQTAQKLNKPIGTVRQWRQRYRAFWDQALAVARREAAADAGDEGLAVLRTLLRSDDDKIRREASTRLVELRPELGDTPAAANDLLRFVEFLEGLSDEQLRSLLDSGLRGADSQPDRHPVDAATSAISA